jgi:hypothetical protein
MPFAPFIYSWLAWIVGVSEPIGVGVQISKIAVISTNEITVILHPLAWASMNI